MEKALADGEMNEKTEWLSAWLTDFETDYSRAAWQTERLAEKFIV